MTSIVPVMLTSRLELRALDAEDAARIFELRSDPKVNKYLLRKPYEERQEAVQFISFINEGILAKKWFYWGINFLEDPELIGTVCLWNFSEDGKSAEIGYELKANLHGFGLMSEVLAPIISFGFKELGLSSICASTHRDNLASIKLLRKFKFVLNPSISFDDRPDDLYFELHSVKSFRSGSSPKK